MFDKVLFDTIMIDMSMIQSFIHDIFHDNSGRTLSKEEIMERVKRSDIAESLPFFRQLADKTDYTEHTLMGEMEDIAKKEGATGAVFGKVGGKKET